MRSDSSDERMHQVEVVISTLLRVGVSTSLFLIVTGMVLSFVHHPEYLSSPAALQRLTAPGAAFPHTWRDVISGARKARGQAIVTVGLWLLIATPVMRVAVSIFAFIVERDRVFTLITATVLCLLILSFVLGKVG